MAMADAEPQELGILAKLVIAALIVLTIAGVLWHGVTFTTIRRVLRQIAERPDAPMAFRFILQPLMAAGAAIHDGRKDARLGRAPYFWALLRMPQERIGRLREGLNATARIVLLGLTMDAVYQVIVLHRFYPVEAVIVALALAFVPYVLLRGLVLRVMSGWRSYTSVNRIR